MSKLLTKSNQTALALSSSIAEIVNPLHLFNINFFQFIRIYNNNSIVCLANNSAWLETFFTNDFFKKGYFCNNAKDLDSSYFLWKNVPHTEVCSTANQYFDIGHGFTICNKQLDYINLYLFASQSSNESINNFYINHLDLFQHFIKFFNEKSQLILKSCVPEVLIPGHATRSVPNQTNLDNLVKEFYKLTQVKKLYCSLTDENVHLTEKQTECLELLLKGFSVKQIAVSLKISPRTCQHYVDSLKEKFHCYSKQELIYKINKTILNFPKG